MSLKYLSLPLVLLLAGCCISVQPGLCPQPVVDAVHIICDVSDDWSDSPSDWMQLPAPYLEEPLPPVHQYDIPEPLFPRIYCIGYYCWDEQGNEYQFDELDLDPRS